MPESDYQTTMHAVGRRFQQTPGQPDPALAASRRASGRDLSNAAEKFSPASRAGDYVSLSQDYAAELEAWARQAAAANGFGDLP